MKLKGSVTIFLTVILIVVLAVVGGLMESARLSVAKEIVLDDAYLSMQNILAEYQRELWNDYHVFFLDGAFLKGDEEIKKKAGDYLDAMVSADEKSFLGAEAVFTDIGMNEAMIEGGCKYFMKQAIRYMKEAAPGELITKAVGETGSGEILNRGQEALKNSLQAKIKLEKKLLEAEKKKAELEVKYSKNNKPSADFKQTEEKSLKEVDIKKSKKAKKNLKKYEKILEQGENSEKKSNWFLDFLSGDSLKVSTKKISKTRWKEFGEDGNEVDNSLVDRGLFLLYIKKHFPHFLSGRKNIEKNPKKQALDYGLEYIVMGGNSDEGNLRGVIQRIFAIRTGLWFSYYSSRPDKVLEATEIATALVGALGPAAVAVVKTAILLGWATESARGDMREIVRGREVFLYPKTGPVKIGYEKYLDLFLMGAVKEWGERSVRLIEQNMKVRYLKEFRADNCFAGLVGNVKGLVPPKFFRLKFLKEFMDEDLKLWEFDFQLSESLCK